MEEGTRSTATPGQQFLSTWQPGCLPEPLLRVQTTFHTSLEQRRATDLTQPASILGDAGRLEVNLSALVRNKTRLKK